MEKVSLEPSFQQMNTFCPQSFFIHGVNKEDGSPNFGAFNWLSYCWDGGPCVMACIGDGKLTIDRIRAERRFSANLVNEPLLPLADYLGSTSGYTPGKMDIPIRIERGAVLDVPVLADSPWVYELEVKRSIPLDGSEVFLCDMRNILAAQNLADESVEAAERVRQLNPIVIMAASGFLKVNPESLGKAGDWQDLYAKSKE